MLTILGADHQQRVAPGEQRGAGRDRGHRQVEVREWRDACQLPADAQGLAHRVQRVEGARIVAERVRGMERVEPAAELAGGRIADATYRIPRLVLAHHVVVEAADVAGQRAERGDQRPPVGQFALGAARFDRGQHGPRPDDQLVFLVLGLEAARPTVEDRIDITPVDAHAAQVEQTGDPAAPQLVARRPAPAGKRLPLQQCRWGAILPALGRRPLRQRPCRERYVELLETSAWGIGRHVRHRSHHRPKEACLVTSTAPESSPKPSKKRRRWIRVLGVVVILMVLVVLLAPLLLSTGWARSKVEVAMADALNTQVAVDGFGFGWFSGVEVDGLRVAQPEGFAGDDELLAFDSLRGDVGLVGLLTGKIAVSGSLDGLRLLVVQKADGTVNLQKLGKPAEDRGEGGAGEGGEGGGSEAPESEPMDLGSVSLDLVLRDARIEIRHEQKGVLERLENVTASVTKPFGTQSIELDFGADLAHGDGTEPGRLELRADAQASRTAPVNAELTCKGLDLERYRPLVEGFAEPGAVEAFAGHVEADVKVSGVPTEKLTIEGLVEVVEPRLAGTMFKGMSISAPRWRLEPGVAASIPTGEASMVDLDLSGLRADLGFLKVDGLAKDAQQRAGLKLDLDVAALADFGGPLPEFLKNSGLSVKGDVRAPLRADLAETPLAELIGALGVDLRITGNSLSVAGQSLVGLAADLRLDQGIASFTTSAGQLDGGALSLKLSADASKLQAADVKIEAGLDGARVVGSAIGALQYVAPFLAGLGEAAPNAVLQSEMTATVAFEGPVMPAEGEAWLGWLNRWSGNGDVAMENGSFAPAPELAGLLQVVGQKDRVAFKDFSTSFTLKDGFVETGLSKLALAGREFGIDGRTSLSGQIDHTIDVRDMLKNHRDGAKVLQYLGDTPIGAKLVGTLADPSLALPDMNALIQQGLKNALQKEGADALKGILGGDKKDGEQPKSPEDALKQAGQGLLNGILGGNRKKDGEQGGGGDDSPKEQPKPEDELKKQAENLLKGILGGSKKRDGSSPQQP